MTPSRNKTRGNKGHFHGDPLEFLLENLPDYLALAPHKKGSFWDTFFPAWDAKYPKLESDELREELEREEAAYKAECEELKAANENEVRKRGRRKAVLQDFPATSDRLNELRACDAEQSKLKNWFSNAKTKEKTRKVEPFRAWLSSLTALRGAPRHVRMPWVLWQHEKHGEILRVRYRDLYGKNTDDEEEDISSADAFEKEDEEEQAGNDDAAPTRAETLHRKLRFAQEYFTELAEEEQQELHVQREKNYQERRSAYEKALQGDTECSAEELEERRAHAEAISQHTLETLCAQLQCKGILILGEIADVETDEIFLSMVQSGTMPGHPDIDFTKWAPVRSKAVLQAFADFLVACKKAEMAHLCSATTQDVLGALLIPGLHPPARRASVLNAWGRSYRSSALHPSLLVVKRRPSLLRPARPAAGSAEEGGEHRAPKGKRRRGTEEAEEEESGAEEDEDDDNWSGGEERDDDLDQPAPSAPRASPSPPPSLRYPPKSPLQRALDAMDTPQRNHRIRDLNTLSEYEFDREQNIARNNELLRALFPVDAATEVGLPQARKPKPAKAARSSTETPSEPRRSSRRLARLESPAPADEGAQAPPDVEMAADERDERALEDEEASSAGVEMSSIPSDALNAASIPPVLPDAASGLGPLASSSEASPNKGAAIEDAAVESAAVESAAGEGAAVNKAASSPAPLQSEKHDVVMKLFQLEGMHPAWAAVVQAWWALERATGFKEKPCRLCPPEDVLMPSAGLDVDDNSKEDFYDSVVGWWNAVNPAWRKDSLAAADFEKVLLKKEGGGSLDALSSGLNGLTSIVACLWWWYRLVGIADGAPRWKNLADDVTWVLTEKLKACGSKRPGSPSEEEPPAKRARLE
ncbi:hypothetical protein B0H14DRAFT_2620363 [Mycena olivaceomarginata]|nr:hypothetical protein B0H14DRAFT_2620363 [Mycena olivaceomarginata]